MILSMESPEKGHKKKEVLLGFEYIRDIELACTLRTPSMYSAFNPT